MNFLQKIGLKLIGKNIDLTNRETFMQYFGDYFKIQGRGDEYVGWLYSAIDTWGLFFAKAHFRLYEDTRKGLIEVRKHPFVDLLQKPNDYQSFFHMKYNWAGHFGLFGDSFVYVIRNQRGEVQGYQQLMPKLVKRKFGKGMIESYEYLLNGEWIPIKKDDIIDLRYPNPYSDTKGFAIISSIADQVEVNDLQMQYLRKFYEQGGFLGLMFSTSKEMSRVSFERTKKMLEEEYQGIDNSFKIGLFDSDLKPIPSAYSVKDADVTAQGHSNRDSILSAFKVSKILIGLAENYTRATADASIYQFTSGVIDPLLNYIDEVLTNHVKQEWGNKYKVVHDTLAPKDQETALNYYKALASIGAISINEIREEEGFNPIESEIANAPIIYGGGVLFRVDTGEAISNTTQATEQPTEQTMSKKMLPDDIKELRWNQFDRTLAVQDRKFKRVLDRYVDAQRRRIVEALQDNFIIEDAFNLSDEDVELYQLLEIEVFEIMKAGFIYGNKIYGNFSLDFLQKNVILEKIINNGLLINKSIYEQIKDKQNIGEVQEVYGNLESVINKTALTTSHGAFNLGLFQVMKLAGIERKMWLTQRDERVRNKVDGENHVVMDGVVVGIDEPFIVPSRNGFDTMMFPADPDGSPENIINDRCTLVEA